MHPRIDYLELSACDITSSKAFLHAVFGWQFTDFGDDYSAFSTDSISGGLYRSQSVARVATGSVLVVFYSADLEVTRQRIIDANGTINKEIFTFPGGRRFHFLEPSGNELAVWSDYDASGRVITLSAIP